MPPESGNSAWIVQASLPKPLNRPTYSALTYETPTSVRMTNRTSWTLTDRRNISASPARTDERGRERLAARGRGQRGRRGRGRQQVAQRRVDAAQLVGQVEIEDEVQVRVVAAHQLTGDADREREGARDP